MARRRFGWCFGVCSAPGPCPKTANVLLIEDLATNCYNDLITKNAFHGNTFENVLWKMLGVLLRSPFRTIDPSITYFVSPYFSQIIVRLGILISLVSKSLCRISEGASWWWLSDNLPELSGCCPCRLRTCRSIHSCDLGANRARSHHHGAHTRFAANDNRTWN